MGCLVLDLQFQRHSDMTEKCEVPNEQEEGLELEQDTPLHAIVPLNK